MIEMEFNLSSVDNLEKKLDYIYKNLPTTVKTGVDNALENTQDVALKNKKGKSDKSFIPIESATINGNEIKGILHTDKNVFSWAPFLEYGTGRFAELEHIGRTYTFKKSGYYFWYAPADEVRKQYEDGDMFEYEGEFYPMNLDLNGKKYVMVFEQKSRPFMRPAFNSEKETNLFLIKSEIRKLLGK